MLLSGFLSSYETALTWINTHRLKSLAKQNSKLGRKAVRVYLLKENFTSTLTIILIWNNFFNIIATILLNLVFDIVFEGNDLPLATTIAIMSSTVLIIIFGEIIPKNIAFRYAEKLSISTVFLLLFFKYITYPLYYIVTLIIKKKVIKVTESDLIEVLDSTENEGIFEHDEKELIKAAVEIKDKIVKDSMVPWDKVSFLKIKPTNKELVQILKNKYHFSRLPILNQSKTKLIGFIKMKDVYAYLILNNKNPLFDNEKVDLTTLIKTPLFVNAEDNLLDVMQLLQQKKLHMAVVTSSLEKKEKNNSKQLIGILTLEDVLEELIGEIYDEHDEILYNEPIVKVGLDCFLIWGNVDFSTIFNNYLDETNKPEGNFRTFHGWVSYASKTKKIDSKFKWDYQNLTIQAHKITKKYIIYKVIEHEVAFTQIDKLIEKDGGNEQKEKK